MSVAGAVAIEPLDPADVVSVVQCVVLDAVVFPYPSARFGMRSSSARMWVARASGDPRVVGFVAGRVSRGVLKLDGLAVDREARRRGIGAALVREALRGACVERLAAVSLHVSVANRAAVTLYEREGFRIVGRLPAFYPSEAYGGERDAYDMLWRPVA